ncbi:MAG: LapA family protein [Xanthomonadales bacterium]|nr:LapA family protein [Xanthomonadales bacterium]
MPTPAHVSKIRLITLLVVFVLVLMVIWQNSDPIRLSVLVFSAVLPLMAWLILFLVIGVLMGVGLMWTYRRRP